MADSPPNFHVSYEKLKKIAEELRGGGDKDAEYWAWRNDARTDEDSSEEDEFMKWISQKRNNNNRRGDEDKGRGQEERRSYRRQPHDDNHPRNRTNHRTRNRSRDGSRERSRERSRDSAGEERLQHPNKRKQSDKKKKKKEQLYDDESAEPRTPVLWEAGEWESSSTSRCYYPPTAPPRTARGGGVIKIPGKVMTSSGATAVSGVERHDPVGEVRNHRSHGRGVKSGDGPHDFIYSDSGSDSDADLNEEYTSAAAISTQLHDCAVLNVVGIEKRIEKCSQEATKGTSTFCKESCQKFLSEGMRKRNSLDVLCEAFEEHHTEIIHLRQELACMLSCAFMYDLHVCQDYQSEGVLWKNVFYTLIQYYRNTITSALSDSVKATLSQQLEEHIGEGISFYNMLVRQIQKRYQVNYKHHTTGHNRTQVLALLLLHKIFLWIGDLYRYLSQTRDSDEWGQARNCYLLAQTLAPRNPRPYHQLALLGKYAHRRLHAVFYFTLSLLVRNPFTQSRELLHGVIAELRRKAVILANRDQDRTSRSCNIPGSKEVYSNKVIEWVFEESSFDGDQSLNIPLPDLRKRLVVYLLSSIGGLITNIDIDRVDPEFDHFCKFYNHYIKLTSFKSDEIYTQLFVVQLYTLHYTSHTPKCLQMLELFLTPALSDDVITHTEDDSWLCKMHSPLSLIFLLVNYQSGCQVGSGMENFTDEFKIRLISWLNLLKTAIQKYKKYTDFTEESVVLKEVTMLRGVELLASLQTITKPFYLKNLSRDQSEDLGRGVLIVSTFEKLSEKLGFMTYDTDKKEFVFVTKSLEEMVEELEILEEGELQEPETVMKVAESGVEVDSETKAKVDYGADAETEAEVGMKHDEGSIDDIDADVGSLSEAESSGSDIEIISKVKISDHQGAKDDDEEDQKMVELREKKEKLLQTLQEKEMKREEVESAVKMIQGMRIIITVKPKYLIPDTNCFLDHLDKLQKLSQSPYRVVIPLIVMDEITGLCKSAEKGQRAAHALDAVSTLIQDKSVALITSKGSILESRDFNEERQPNVTNDDLILNSVICLSDQTGSSEERQGSLRLTRIVVLLTDDGNLRLKAHSQNLAVQTIADFVGCAKILGKKVKVSSFINLRGNL